MSSSSTTATGSRSPSPLTPEASDSLDPVAIQCDDDISSWYSMNPAKGPHAQWIDQSLYMPSHKSEDDQMLRLDELLEQHAYDEYASFTSQSPNSSPSPDSNVSPEYPSPTSHRTSPVQKHADTSMANFRPSNLLVPSHNGSVTLTKPIPPPASLPRKQDPSTINQSVVYPPKELCFNLPIIFPSIPEGGTKSRVETQVRVTVDLADAGSSSDPYKYDRVGSWKWLKLPPGTATKKRTRKQGKIADPEPQDVLHLSAYITCASPPHNRVLSCSSCQAREAKRVAKKLAARVRPARSDSDSGEGDPNNKLMGKQHEDTTSIIQFNCAEVLDFSTGSVVLPLRITCYCRHHREKIGFNVHFTMADHTGRVVGAGTSQPIMITDDHKTATNTQRQTELPPINGFTPVESDWSQMGGTIHEVSAPDSRAPSKRKKDVLSNIVCKKRPKPYDSSSKPMRASREGSVSSIPSPSTSYSSPPMTRSPTPSLLQQFLSSEQIAPPQHPPPPLLPQHPFHGSETSSPDSLPTPLDQSPDIPMPDAIPQHQQQMALSASMNPPTMVIPTHPPTMPFMFFDQSGAPQTIAIQIPRIHRLIPNMGPTHGGIEVTVLGANFHSSLQLNCIFGDVAASSTQRWSDNTLVCVLPPRATAGVVAVWFDGFPKMDDQINSPPSLFTYMDESDRALMELALQVVGLKMTGKIEDAKNVAMRIVGSAGGDDSQSQGGNQTGMMQLASSLATRDIRPLLLRRTVEGENFEDIIVNFLALLDTPLDGNAPNEISTVDAISHASSSGQTLLHLGAFLGFASLVKFLVQHGADLDARDRNGYTPLHFATLSKSIACAQILLEGGADREIVNVLGKTAEEIAPKEFFRGILPRLDEVDSDLERSEDEEAEWGDAEEDADDDVQRIASRRASYRALRRGLAASGRGTPRRSVDISRAATPPPALPEKASDDKKVIAPSTVDAKQAASFLEMIQRTLAQFPAPPQLPLPQLPQLPKHLPNLPDLPAVPWGALPQLPMVFPVFVPMMPGWPSLFGGEHQAATGDKVGDEAARGVGAQAVKAAQEWRATWEKWVALAVATTAGQQIEDIPPPMYTPRVGEDGATQASSDVKENIQREKPEAGPSTTRPHVATDIRPVGYGSLVPEQEVDAYVYQPPAKQTKKLQKKHDRMLLLFWLPILFLSMLWAFHNGVKFVFQAVKTIIPMRNAIAN
ncbi:hypothetical protein BDQ12DRAFT_593514 [Crucibulum laeve]|uniref:IPT/TIG domain-containing protein n=1 Tax=Crucibulum laeve TaxID=68775 RepID=A0A5C3MSM3_9AGAR|nr:hypothetical protein BDQ12DRAFT_593514 [Crucibulum laeve]